MPMGPGKYDPECTRDLMENQADAVLLIVLGGKKGSGFSIATLSAEILVAVPAILRDTANQIEASGGHDSQWPETREATPQEEELLRLRGSEKALQRSLAAFEWHPITSDHLPGFGNLVLMEGCTAAMVKNFTKQWPFEDWIKNGWRWYAALNLPAEVREANRKEQ